MKKTLSTRTHKTPKLGQHFLTSTKALESIVLAGNITSTDTILEIGPGKGVLTTELLAKAKKVVGLEKDPELVVHLKQLFALQIREGRLVLIEGDALAYEPSDLGTYKLIANIPYYITGLIIRKFLTASNQPEKMVLLVQKEIAERIARSEKESILSISVKAYGTPRYVDTVKAGSFSPPPKVDSAILAIDTISRDYFARITEDWFFTVVKAGFAAKRKQLQGNLGAIASKNTIADALSVCGILSDARGEDVHIETWGRLARELGR